MLKLSALAFAAGGALAAISGTLVSTFISFSASIGVVYTLKALIVIIMGGVGRMMGAWPPACCWAWRSRWAATDRPGLTLAINFALFLIVLLVRPTGLFSRG